MITQDRRERGVLVEARVTVGGMDPAQRPQASAPVVMTNATGFDVRK